MIGRDTTCAEETRAMSTAVEDCAVQRTAGGKEQGRDQSVWQVLRVWSLLYWAACMRVGINDVSPRATLW